VTCLKLVPGDQPFVLSTGVDNKLIVWNASTNAYCGGTDCTIGIQDVELGAIPDPTANDGRQLNCLFLSCKQGEFQIREWDSDLTLRVRMGKRGHRNMAHNFGTSSIVVLDGGQFYTAGRDGKIMVWSVRPKGGRR